MTFVPFQRRIDVPITFTTADGDVVHAPMVEVRFDGGVATRVVVDTGASDHVLTTELAGRIGLHVDPGEPGTDIDGASVPSWYGGDVGLSFGDATATVMLHDVVVIDGPPLFARWGIGGIVSPQRLHPSGVVVVDLADDVLTLADATDATDAPEGSWYAVDVQRHGGGVLCVDAAVAPFAPRSMFLDSGAPGTEVARSVVPGHAYDSADHGGAVVSDQLLVVAGVTFRVPALRVRDSLPAPEGSTADDAPHGLIGMDVMKGSVVVIPPADGAEGAEGAEGALAQWFVRSPAAGG